MKSTAVDQSSSVVASTPAIQSGSVTESTRVVSVYASSSVNGANSVTRRSSGIDFTLVPTSSSVVNAMEQTTQTSQLASNDDQIGLILGITVAGSAAVVMIIGAIVLTATTIYNSHVKRTQIIQNDAISIGLESLDNTLSTHI